MPSATISCRPIRSSHFLFNRHRGARLARPASMRCATTGCRRIICGGRTERSEIATAAELAEVLESQLDIVIPDRSRLRGQGRATENRGGEAMTAFPFSTCRRSSKAATPRNRWRIRSTSPAMPSGSATSATGWPSTTTCRASPVRRHRSSSPMSRAAPRPSASAPAASCCPTIRRWSSPSSSARWRRCIPAASTSASAARPAPTWRRRGRCAAISMPASTISRRTSSS